MPRKRQDKVNEATRLQIKQTARRLMAEKGTAGLSLRAIARLMGITAPALYHYFPSLDDLITALIVDAFTGHADFVRRARDSAAEAGQPYTEQIFVSMLAWAIQNPIDFQLIYGSPIPGYVAPVAITTPAAQRMGDVFMETIVMARQADEFHIPVGFHDIPATVQRHYREQLGLPDEVTPTFHLMNHAWGLMHGLVSLEINNHFGPVVGDTDSFYEQTIRQLFHAIQDQSSQGLFRAVYVNQIHL